MGAPRLLRVAYPLVPSPDRARRRRQGQCALAQITATRRAASNAGNCLVVSSQPSRAPSPPCRPSPPRATCPRQGRSDHGPIGAGGGIHPLPAHSACHLEQDASDQRYKAHDGPYAARPASPAHAARSDSRPSGLSHDRPRRPVSAFPQGRKRCGADGGRPLRQGCRGSLRRGHGPETGTVSTLIIRSCPAKATHTAAPVGVSWCSEASHSFLRVAADWTIRSRSRRTC